MIIDNRYLKSGENMDEKGRRFAPQTEEPVDQLKQTASDETETEDHAPRAKHAASKDKRLKDKNAKKLEKLLKKQKKKDKRAGRDFPDDEEIPAEQGAEEGDFDVESQTEEHHRTPKKSSRKKIIAVAVIIVLLFAVVFFAFNSDKLSFHNISNFFQYGLLNKQSEEKFPLDIKGESISAGNFIRIGQDICYSSDTKTRLLNNYGRSLFSAQHAFINPVLTTGEKGCLVYNLGGTGYQLIDKEGAVYSAEAENNILVANYSDSGAYAIVTQSGGYLSKLYVYNEKHEQIFAYSFADYYVTSVSLNSGGTKAVVAGVSALNGVNIASVYVLDFTKDTPLHFKELENNIIYEVEYIGDKYACAIGRSASYTVNTSNGEIVTNNYDGRNLTAFDINRDTDTYTLSLSGSGDGRNCDIISYNTSGAQEKSFTVDEKVIDLSTYKGRVALLTGDKVMLYSKDGNSISEKELSSDPHSVALYTSSDAYVLCTGYINAYRL